MTEEKKPAEEPKAAEVAGDELTDEELKGAAGGAKSRVRTLATTWGQGGIKPVRTLATTWGQGGIKGSG